MELGRIPNIMNAIRSQRQNTLNENCLMWRRQLFRFDFDFNFCTPRFTQWIIYGWFLMFTLREWICYLFFGINSKSYFSLEKCLRIKRLPTTKLIDFTLREKVETSCQTKTLRFFFSASQCYFQCGTTTRSWPFPIGKIGWNNANSFDYHKLDEC